MARDRGEWQDRAMLRGRRLRNWSGPPLLLQILALLVGVLVVAQLVTLLLTIVLPPAPPQRYSMRDIAQALRGASVEARGGRALERVVRAAPPDISGSGWLISEPSRSELARLLGVASDRVALAFFTQLPFGGGTTPPPPPPPDQRRPAEAPRALLSPPRAVPAETLPILALQEMPGGPPPGGFPSGGFPSGGMPGGPPPEPGFPPGGDRGMPPPDQAKGERGETRVGGDGPARGEGSRGDAAARARDSMRQAPTGSLIAPRRERAPDQPSRDAAPQQPAVARSAEQPASRPVERSETPTSITPPAPPPAVGGADPAGIAGGMSSPPLGGFAERPRSVPVRPEGRAVSESAAMAARPPTILSAAPAPVAELAPPSPSPLAVPATQAPPSATRAAPPAAAVVPGRVPTRAQFGLAPAAFVEGDFVAALRLPDGRWAVVAPRPESFPTAWQRRVGLWFLLSLALIAPFAWIFARRIVRPLKGFAVAAEALGRDPAAAIVPLSGPAEVGRAARAFTLMQSRLRAFVDDRTAMVGAISHDLRTPLTRLRFRIEDVPDDQRDGLLGEVAEMEAMIASVIEFIRDASTPGARERIDLTELADDAVQNARLVGADVSIEPAGPIPVEADAMGMRRLLDNLLSNAVKYGVRARVRLSTEGDNAVAEIVDDGPGIPDEEIERVFEPFYRSPAAQRSDKRGHGLGLAVCRSIARAHGGDVRLMRSPEGFVARVAVPLAYGDLPKAA